MTEPKGYDWNALAENFCDEELTAEEREAAMNRYKERAQEWKRIKAEHVVKIMSEYPNGIAYLRQLRDDHRYSLLAYLDEEICLATFYGVNPDVNPFFVTVRDFCNITDLVMVHPEREFASRNIAHGPW